MNKREFTLNADMAANLQEGVFWLDDQGRVKTFNTAANAWLRQCLAQADRLARMVDEARHGVLPLPAWIDLIEPEPDAHAPATWLARDDDKGFVLIVMRPSDMVQEADARTSGMISLIGPEVREEFARLAGLLAKLTQGGVHREELLGIAQEVAGMLVEVSDLAELHQRDLSFDDERFPLAPLVAEILPQLPFQTGPGAIEYAVRDDGGSGQIYGNREWLRHALHTLFVKVGEGCAPGYRVQASVRQLGDFVVLSVGSSLRRDTPGVARSRFEENHSSAAAWEGLHMQVCRRIIELHGGRMRTAHAEQTPGDRHPARLESFMLTLPTGVPSNDRSRVSCASCRVTHQAMEYARDLSNLLIDR